MMTRKTSEVIWRSGDSTEDRHQIEKKERKKINE